MGSKSPNSRLNYTVTGKEPHVQTHLELPMSHEPPSIPRVVVASGFLVLRFRGFRAQGFGLHGFRRAPEIQGSGIEAFFSEFC